MNDTTPLRERKRRATFRRIEDAATALVEKHGFDNVTVEDICRDADISRRTFFNYMDSKDEAVLGVSPMMLSPERQEEFVATPSDNLVKSALEHIAASLHDAESEDLEPGTDAGHLATVRVRRQRIIAAEPAAALMSINRFREQSTLVHGLIERHLEDHPADRRLPDQPLPVEAAIISGLIRETVWVHMHRLTPCPDLPAAESLDLAETGTIITQLAKELTW